jgi:hypothetical protein
VSKNKEAKEQKRAGARNAAEGERRYYNSTQLAHFAYSFSLYVLSTERLARCLNDL